jgi:hypothetical protein
VSAYFAAKHVLQSPTPVDPLYLAFGHAAQSVPDDPLYPLLHEHEALEVAATATDDAWPWSVAAVPNVPQDVHDSDACEAAYLPFKHPEQLFEPGFAENLPSGHAVHVPVYAPFCFTRSSL